MEGNIIGFVIWILCGCMFVCLGVYGFFAKKPLGFWANAKVFEVTDIKKYNRAVGKLFCTFGIVFAILGIPLISGQNSPWILLSVLGIMIETIVAMAVYSLVFEKKYKKTGI